MALKDPVRIHWRERSYLDATRRDLERGMAAAGAFVTSEVKSSLSVGNVTGKEPSASGEPPRTVTGALRSNIDFVVESDPGEVRGFVGVRRGPADAYARRLELGFVGRDSLGRFYQQEPRPYLRPAVFDNRREIMRRIARGAG